MFSITLKRSVVTVGVVAGLLATAGPASAKTVLADSNAQRVIELPEEADAQRVVELPEEADAQVISNPSPRTPRP
jgi:hypothetical protein